MVFWKDEEAWRCNKRGILHPPRQVAQQDSSWVSFKDQLPQGDQLLVRMARQGVQLESVMVRAPMLFLTIRVSNFSFKKDVTVRMSEDNWTTSQDVPASYLTGSSDGQTDRFYATLTVKPSIPCDKMQFAVCYTVNDKQYWDNNNGANYTIHVNNPSSMVSNC